MRKKLMAALGYLLVAAVAVFVVAMTVVDLGWQAAAATWGVSIVLLLIGAAGVWLIDRGRS